MKIGIVSLGCAKNLVDTEIVLGFLINCGHELVSDPRQAEIIIVNTCGFIRPAKEESIAAILEMAEFKQKGRCRGLIVMGCLSQRYAEQLQAEIGEIDGILGVNEADRINEAIEEICSGKRVVWQQNTLFDYNRVYPRVSTGGPHFAYLKIAEGCSHNCAFCVIPQIRGRFRSRDPNIVIDEARCFAEQGVQELAVIAQDTTAYGRDKGSSIAKLLKELSKLDIPWIRLLYTHPAFITAELLELIRDTPNLVEYIDLPLQHVSGRILRRMGRPGNDGFGAALIGKIRRAIPKAIIRSSFIVGFPGETEQEFNALLDFLEKMRLNHVGIFKYSREEGSAAYHFKDQVPEEIKARRWQQAMALQQRISLELNQKLVGSELSVLLERPSEESNLVLLGRHRGQAPDVDGNVYIGRGDLNPGKIVKVRITEAHAYDLVGEVVV